jgi:CBS domain-containing protein
VIVIPVIGGLIVGLMAKYGTPKIKGHGIPEAMEAVLINQSRIAPRVAILKPISAAIAIGTGGPFGAEGPIIQTGGAIGSLVGQALHTTASERKVLLACGAAAGMSATFVVAASAKVSKVAEGIARHDPALTRHQALLIVDSEGKLAGIITRGDILRALDKDPSGPMTVQEAGKTHLVVTYPDELISEAAAKMLRFDVGRLPVVDRSDDRKVVGYLGRSGILAARLRRLHDEHVREPGWLKGFARRATATDQN